MPPHTKLTRHTAPGTNALMDKAEICGWERSKISNQDQKTLKKLGMLKKQDSLIFPGDESFPRPPIGYRVTFIDHLIRGLSTPIHEFLRGLLFVNRIQLHQLTPNTILDISIFITLCECFLGTHPHWGLWKHIFYLRRNNSRNIVYNVGGVCICVRPDVDYFDVKFPDSIQGWRKRWLYVQDQYKNSHDMASFHLKLPKKFSGADLGTQRPLPKKRQATKFYLLSPLPEAERWMSERLSSTTRKKLLVLRVKPRDLRNPRRPPKKRLTQIALNLAAPSLLLSPFLLGTRGRGMMSKIPAPPSLPSRLPKKLRLKKRVPLTLTMTLAPLAPLKRKEKKKNQQSMARLLRAHPTLWFFLKNTACCRIFASPSKEQGNIDSFGQPLSTCAEESEDWGWRHSRDCRGEFVDSFPMMKHFISLGSQSIKFRDEADALKAKLELSEKAKADAAAVEDLRQWLQTAENALSDKIAQQIERENAIADRFDTQNRRFVRRMGEEFTLHEGVEDRLLDTLSILELQGDLAGTNISNAGATFKRLFPHFFPKQTQPEIFSELVRRFLGEEDLALAYRQDNLKIGIEETIALVAHSQQDVDWTKVGNPKGMNKEKWKALVKDAKPHSKKILSFLSPKSAASASTAKTEVK
ncbi:hypothetical protein QYE76_031215 [Lolium multiflorum]|uniref:Transposase (putative) gypsy type domain-containing protein n=1 Tax=Lolium multiflorum TaxID=4521 RepID=A0AAD8QTN2_LOLMU|nr:hypothetical protein QYE76_031215 [Lolium multiflorum]